MGFPKNAIRTVMVASSLFAAAAPRLVAQVRYTRDDVRFMQSMIAHHAQALTMAALIVNRTERPELLSLGERIAVSQRDEIAAMQRWLTLRHEVVPRPDAAHPHDAASMTGIYMPGMLSEAEMMDLEEAKGEAFERRFLAGMIKHHEGAIAMVRELFHSPGAGQESEIFRFASDVEADQRAEIARMRLLLDKLPKSANP